jgi:hypothetical protein
MCSLIRRVQQTHSITLGGNRNVSAPEMSGWSFDRVAGSR